MFLGIAWATNIGGKLTPSGSVPNMVAIGLASSVDYRIGYAQWFLANCVFTGLQTLAMFVVLRTFLSRKDQEYEVPRDRLREELKQLGPFSRGEKIACGALATALTFWILPDIVPLVLGRTDPVAVWFTTRLNWGVVAMLVGCSLFLIPVDWKARRFTITWDEAIQNVEWGTIALTSGSIALGELIVDRNVGLGALFNAGVTQIAGANTPPFLVISGIIVATVLFSQVASGVAIVSALGAVALVVAPTLRLNPIALLVTISLAANMGYTLPSSTPPNAIVFASGYVRIVPMFLRGSILAVIGIVLLSLTGYQMADWVFPWPLPGP
jgi:sodium-dependent dicarboxylate transporter 2/3/5